MATAGLVMFWTGVAWIAYVFAGYPAALWLAGRTRPFRHTIAAGFTPSVSVLIAARNEAKDIGWKIRETLEWDYPANRLEVLVASDASDDGTDEIVRSIGDPRVRLARMERRGGKVRAVNRLIETSRSDLLLFTDANTHMSSDALRRLASHFADPRVGIVTGRTQPAGKANLVGAGAAVYWDYESLVASLESRMGAVLVCDGAIHCARRSLAGAMRPNLANDLELPVRVRAQGYRAVFEPLAVATEMETESTGEEFRRRRRICGQGALALWELRAHISGLMAWQFLSRKLLRWLLICPLLLTLGGSALQAREPFFAAILLAQVAFYSMAAAAHFFRSEAQARGPWFALPYYVAIGAAGALRGVLDMIGGRRFDVWEVAGQSRGR